MLIASAKRFVSALTKRGKSGGMALIRMSLGVFVLGLVAGCHTAPQPTRSADWDKYVAGYLEAYFAVPMMGATLMTANVRLPNEQLAWTLQFPWAENTGDRRA